MTIDDVLSGRSRWAIVEGDCLAVLPMLADKSVAHVITDPPYEAEAHTQQRRVARNLPGGADDGKRTPLVCANLRRAAGVGGSGNCSSHGAMGHCVLSGRGRDEVG